MKLTAFLLLAVCLQAGASGYAQQITLSETNVSLKKIFKEIERQSEYHFFYKDKLLKQAGSVSVNVRNATVEEVLDQCFKEQPLTYAILEKIIVIKEKKLYTLPASAPIEHISAPSNIIGGSVKDAQGNPLAGVSVVVRGTNRGTSTTTNGGFSIDANVGDVLEFTIVGYQKKSVTIEQSNNISIVMEIEVSVGNEVVVVGYGTQTARQVTGSVSKVKMSETENLPNTNIAQALRGRVAGIQFTDNGRPGQSGSILIRGPISLSASNNPLVVLDGIIFNGSMTDINPNDLVSMDILKDASAAAIYGSRAANGVILLTSKRGISDKPAIRFNTFHGVSDFSYKVKLLDENRYIEEKVDVQRELGNVVTPDDINNLNLGTNEIENYLAGKWIDPWEEGSQKAGVNSYDLNVSGKTKKTNYFLSGSWTDEKGLIKNDRLKRLSLRSNIELNITDWLTTGMNSMYVNKDNSGVIVDIDNLVQSSPYATWYREDGTPTEYVVDGETVAGSPVLSSYYQSNEKIENDLFSNFYALINVPFIKGLSYRMNYSPNLRWNHNYSYERQNKHLTNNTTWASKNNQNAFDWVMENIIKYQKQLNKHFFDVTMLYGRNHTFFENTTARADRLSLDALGWDDLSLGETQITSSHGERTEGNSYMFRLNYNFINRYFLTLTARRDGSSVFAENNKYGTFPSASFAWILSDESFLNEAHFIDFLKMRLSYGSVGNQAISPYQSLGLLATTQYVFDGGSTSLGIYPNNMANPDLKWETTYKTNFGIDFSILKSRISGTIDLYNMKTKDLLVDRALPQMTGFSSVLTNIGEVNNKGIEITLNTLNIIKNKFEWRTTLIFSRNKNKIVHLYYTDTNGDGKEDDDIGNNWFIGHPITVFYDYVFDGIYQERDNLPSDTHPGDVRLKDLNNDGIIDFNDRAIIGQGGQPKFKWGVTNNFKYGNFEFSIFINSMQGWISDFPFIFRGSTQQRSLNWVDTGWWTPENKSNKASSLLYQNKYGHGWYESRDFIRIQDVALSYNLPKKLLEEWNISTLRFFISGKNLKTFTNWRGSDPEIGLNGGGRGHGSYPMSKTISIGLNLGF